MSGLSGDFAEPEAMPWEIHMGLKHGPQGADWDPDTTVWSVEAFSFDQGVIDGWRWATDTFTALVERAEGGPDWTPWSGGEISKRDFYLASRCWELTHPDPAPDQAFLTDALSWAVIGGAGGLVPFGVFDLDRVSQAAWWVAGPDESQVRVGTTNTQAGNRLLHLLSGDRRATVVAIEPRDAWLPTIAGLPMDGPLRGGWDVDLSGSRAETE